MLILIVEKIPCWESCDMHKDVGPMHGGRDHQENLKNLKHLVSISDRGRRKACSVKMGGHLAGVEG